MIKIKSLTICLALAGVAVLAACSDDDAGKEYTRANTVDIVKSNLTFDANAQQGSVQFTVPSGAVATATVNANWATAQLAGDSVVVSVTDNTGVESRSAMLTIHNGADSTNVPILQAGAQFQYRGANQYVVNDNDTTITLPFTRKGALVNISASDSSIIGSTQRNDTSFTVAIAANNTGNFRHTELYISSFGETDTISVVQGQQKDLVDKMFYFQAYDVAKADESHTTLGSVEVQYMGYFDEQDGQLFYVMPLNVNSGLLATTAIPMEFNDSTLTLTVTGANTTGSYTSEDYPGYTFYQRTSIIDETFFNVFNQLYQQNHQYNFFSLMTNRNLSLSAQLRFTSQGFLVAELLDSGDNDWFAEYLNQNLTSSLPTTYDATYLGLDGYIISNQRWVYVGSDALFDYPVLINVPGSQAKSGKAQKLSRSQLGIHTPSVSMSKFQADAAHMRALKSQVNLKAPAAAKQLKDVRRR